MMFFSADVRMLSPVFRESYKLVRRVLTQTPVCHEIGPKNEAKMVTVTHKGHTTREKSQTDGVELFRQAFPVSLE